MHVGQSVAIISEIDIVNRDDDDGEDEDDCMIPNRLASNLICRPAVPP